MIHKILFAAVISFSTLKLSAQLSIKNPLICHNKQDELECYDDGSFKLSFKDAAFAAFTTYDSSISFFEAGRYLELRNPQSNDGPLKIQLTGKGVSFVSAAGTEMVDSVKRTAFNMNGTAFELYKSEQGFTVEFSLNGQTVFLDILTAGNPKNKWHWGLITVKKGGSRLWLGYNPYYNAGPSLLSRQDDSLRYGISISHSFKTNRYVWIVKPVFSERTEKGYTIYNLPDFYYEYNRKGKLKPKKCRGAINYCSTE